jgi:hypothetical protein
LAQPSGPMRQDLEQLSRRIAQVKPADAPRLIGQWMDNDAAQTLGALVERIDILDRDRQVRHLGARGALGRETSLIDLPLSSEELPLRCSSGIKAVIHHASRDCR